MVQAAEWAGQARALGTGIAAGKNRAKQRVRLRFLYQKIKLLADTAFAILQPQSELFRLSQRERVIEDFLHCIEQELLGKEHPDIAATVYFQRATYAIDELLALVDAVLQQQQR